MVKWMNDYDSICDNSTHQLMQKKNWSKTSRNLSKPTPNPTRIRKVTEMNDMDIQEIRQSGECKGGFLPIFLCVPWSPLASGEAYGPFSE